MRERRADCVDLLPDGRDCDNGGTRINVNSGLMGDFIDSTIDDQNTALTGLLIGPE